MDGVLAIFAKAAVDHGPVGLLVAVLVGLLGYLVFKCHADSRSRDELHRDDMKEQTSLIGDNTKALMQIR